jgi:hypothetical protein
VRTVVKNPKLKAVWYLNSAIGKEREGGLLLLLLSEACQRWNGDFIELLWGRFLCRW